MIEQLKTIRENARRISDSGLKGPQGLADRILEALTQLEAMAGSQEPVAWCVGHSGVLHFFPKREAAEAERVEAQRFSDDPIEPIRPLVFGDVAPVAQQPQARPDFTDEWTGYLKDGETPFERFLRERKDVQSALKLYQRALEENERLKAQQPQAEKPLAPLEPASSYVQPVPDHCDRIVWRNRYYHLPLKQPQAEPDAHCITTPDGGCISTDPRCMHQPQAEAVPVVDRVYEAAKRLVDHADFQLGGVLSAKSKARDIPSNAASKVKARHLASLRDALAKTPQQAEAAPRTHVLVPKRMTRAMERVTEEEGWAWADLLAAAESITEAEYGEIQMDDATPQQAEAVPQPPEDWHIFNSGAEVASGLTWAEAWDYMTPSRIERGWTAVCVADKSNLGAAIAQQKGGV